MIVVGEVHTGLLQHSCALPDREVSRLLDLAPGEPVRQSTRPVSYAVSPELLTGVDCDMTATSGRSTRVVGTAMCRAAVLGGHVLQASTFTELSSEWVQQRQPWAHYLARPGVLKAIGKADARALARGFLEPSSSSTLLDIGAVSGRTMDIVQGAGLLDRRAPFRATRTRLRWVVTPADGKTSAESEMTFALVDPQFRTLAMTCGAADVRMTAQLCEDFAVHDWLLTTVIGLVGRARIGGGPRLETIDRLRPVIDYLAHLWVPTARLHPDVAHLWQKLEQRPGFSRQWQTLITRIRDQMALASLSAPQGDGRVHRIVRDRCR